MKMRKRVIIKKKSKRYSRTSKTGFARRRKKHCDYSTISLTTKIIKEIKILLLALAIVSIIAGVAIFSTISLRKMVGYSMLPELNNNDVFVVNRNAKLDRFAIVYIKEPDRKNRKSVRRIIGMPGDELYYKNDELVINNIGKTERYLNKTKNSLAGGILTEDFTLKGLTGKARVPKKKYFVMGDNRQNSIDSRDYGFITSEQILGRVEIILPQLLN